MLCREHPEIGCFFIAVKEKEESLLAAQEEEKKAISAFEEADGIFDEAVSVISPVLAEALTDSAWDVRIANKVLGTKQGMVEKNFFAKEYLICMKEIEEVLQPALDEAEAAYTEALKTSDFDETYYAELVEKAKTDEVAKEELTAYEEKYASIITLKKAKDTAAQQLLWKESESEMYYYDAIQVIRDLEDAEKVVTFVEARNDALVSFDTSVKDISGKDPVTEDVSSLIATMEETVSR